MNEVQEALGKWLLKAFNNIDAKAKEEAAHFGYTQERLEETGAQIVHNVQAGLIEGCSQITYAIKDGEQLFNILTVEFRITGYVMHAHRKTRIGKKIIALGNLKRN